MNYDYIEEKQKRGVTIVYIRLKYERKYYRCEYFDGMRITFNSIPTGKHRYETRHSDCDISYPVTIALEEKFVVVNFCGTIISDIPIKINQEKRIMEILYSGDCNEEYAKANSYN